MRSPRKLIAGNCWPTRGVQPITVSYCVFQEYLQFNDVQQGSLRLNDLGFFNAGYTAFGRPDSPASKMAVSLANAEFALIRLPILAVYQVLEEHESLGPLIACVRGGLRFSKRMTLLVDELERACSAGMASCLDVKLTAAPSLVIESQLSWSRQL